MIGFSFEKFIPQGKQTDVLIDTAQDDDVNTDDEVLRSGT